MRGLNSFHNKEPSEMEDVVRDDVDKVKCTTYQCPECKETWDFNKRLGKLHFFRGMDNIRFKKKSCPLCSGKKMIDTIVTDNH